MTLTKEAILEAITKGACASGEHVQDYVPILDPEKLAEFLSKHVPEHTHEVAGSVIQENP